MELDAAARLALAEDIKTKITRYREETEHGKFYVYVKFHPRTFLPIYIGKGYGDRWRQPASRYRHNQRLHRVLTKYGDAPTVRVLRGLAENEAHEMERVLISKFGRTPFGPLYNATDGGEGAVGAVRSPETRAKMSKAKTGIEFSLEHRQKLGAAKAGKPSPLKGRASPLRGRSRPPEFVEKLRAALANRGPHSAETKEKMRAAWVRRKARKENGD
jgi:hypothetical protein